MEQSTKLQSLNVFGGVSIAGIIVNNNPGTWATIYEPLKHVKWDGLAPSDLLMPLVVFVIGILMFFELRESGFQTTGKSIYKVIKRTTIMLLVAFALNLLFKFIYNGGYSEDFFDTLRISGVLQRVALAYGVAALIVLAVDQKYIIHVAGVILLGYGALLGFTDSTLLSEANIIAVIDRAILGEAHMYTQTLDSGRVIAFDPEGLLSTISSVAQVLLGFFVGKLVADAKGNKESMLCNLFILGTIMLFAGWLLSYGCPVNKKLWSSTFVLVTSGLGTLLYALIIWAMDVKGKKWGTTLFAPFGVNILYLYVQSSIIGILFYYTGVSSFLFSSVFNPIFGGYAGSLAYALFFLFINWIPAYFLYKKQIYIKL